MLEQTILRERFELLLQQERQAEKMYAELSAKVTDAAMREQIEQLRREKQRHVALTERLLELVE